jgi:hypothetical protein
MVGARQCRVPTVLCTFFGLFETVISLKLFFIWLQKILDFMQPSYYSINVATATSEASANTLQG